MLSKLVKVTLEMSVTVSYILTYNFLVFWYIKTYIGLICLRFTYSKPTKAE